uniref:receptor protein-tyrosine kinase n=1 Tax=Sphenodon punctatus TaxID=8508 RepID=A0A8D0L4A5_SPHPU
MKGRAQNPTLPFVIENKRRPMANIFEDLGCYLNSQSTVTTYKTAKAAEVNVLEDIELKAIMNISENISCLWVFKHNQIDCKSSLDSENRHIVSMAFTKIQETQAGKYMLLIKSESNNYTVIFTVLLRSKYELRTKALPSILDPVNNSISNFSCTNRISEPYKNEEIYGTQQVPGGLPTNTYFGPDVWCCAANQLDSVCSKLYTIDLNEKSDRPLPDFFLKVGDPLLLRCRAIYKDYKYEIKQLEEADYCEASSMVRIVYAYASAVGRNDSGRYTCSSTKHPAKTALVTVLEKGFINVTDSREEFEIDPQDKFCFEVKLKAYPPIRCIWISSHKSFPCNQTYSVDGYSISSRFCDHEHWPGEYVFYAGNDDTSVKRTLKLYVKSEYTLMCSFLFSCTEITDRISNDTLERTSFGSWSSRSTLYPEEAVMGVLFKCCANNSAGLSCETDFINPRGVVSSLQRNVAFYATIGFCLPLMAVLFIFACHKNRKQFQYEGQLQMIQMVGPSDNEYIYIDFREFEYDLNWEFPRENLEFGQLLGSGAFGKVVNATAYGISETGVSVQVAVKMLKEKPTASEKDALMAELKMMTHIGSHENIVNLLGACTMAGPIYLIFEYCCYGDLLNYLRSKREKFHRTWADIYKQHNFSFYHNFPWKPGSRMYDFGNMQLKQDNVLISELDGVALYSEEELNYVNRRMYEEEDINVLTFEDLLCFSYQIAKGMEFLESKSCIHRDLAARNILVTHGKVVKICDFGLARDIVNDSNYVVRGNARLPVKWMAPESIFEGIYTIKSDVWSYGILLWEIFSLGVNPYPGIQVDTDFYKLIQSGFKMDQPFYATKKIYFIMQSCWALDSRKRPSFSQLLSLLASQLADAEGE